MFSIGILGFLVWSLLVALLYCEVEVINLDVCWNSIMLVGTYNSKNSTSLTKSAGNRYFSISSETTGEGSFNFYSFNSFRNALNLKPINDKWLAWFIGFTEGDGAIFTSVKDKRLQFVLTQRLFPTILYIEKLTIVKT